MNVDMLSRYDFHVKYGDEIYRVFAISLNPTVWTVSKVLSLVSYRNKFDNLESALEFVSYRISLTYGEK